MVVINHFLLYCLYLALKIFWGFGTSSELEDWHRGTPCVYHSLMFCSFTQVTGILINILAKWKEQVQAFGLLCCSFIAFRTEIAPAMLLKKCNI